MSTYPVPTTPDSTASPVLSAALVEQRLADLTGHEWPLLQSVSVDDTDPNTVTLALRVQPELSWFEGHYPTMPILAGIAQVHIAAGLGCHVYDIDHDFTGLDAVKFTRLIEPETDVSLRLNFTANPRVLRFVFTSESHTCSSGRILFGDV